MESTKKSGGNSEDGSEKESILTVLARPRKIVRDWGKYKIMGPGVEFIRDPWYFYRPVFNHLWQNLYLGMGHEGARSIERLTIPKQHLYYLSMLLHEALLKENYAQAGYAMIAIARNPQHVPEQIWKCGLEILKKCSSRMMSKTLQYQNLMAGLCPQYSSQMVLDMAFHLLRSKNDLQEAYQYLTGHINNKRVKYDPLFRAYLGMFEYSLWRLDVNRTEERGCDETEAEESVTVHFYAKKALVNMRGVLEEAGSWDVFVLKMVEILDYYRRYDEAVEILAIYRDKNMENPNCHRYLYWYLKKQNGDKMKLFDILKDLIDLDVTSELAHDYIALLNEKDLKCQVIELLFLRLDHVSCKNSLEDWKLLAKNYKTYKRGCQSPEWDKLGRCLSDRKTWWPKYHFNTRKKKRPEDTAVGENDVLLAKYKRRISRYFKKTGSEKDSDHVTYRESIMGYVGRSMESNARKRRVAEDETAIECKRKRS